YYPSVTVTGIVVWYIFREPSWYMTVILEALSAAAKTTSSWAMLFSLDQEIQVADPVKPNRFRVALSFPGEHRPRVERIADALADGEVAAAILSRLGDAPRKTHRVFTSKLPIVNPTLIGREEQLAFLDSAWADPAANFVQVIAAGGTGKTALPQKIRRKPDVR